MLFNVYLCLIDVCLCLVVVSFEFADWAITVWEPFIDFNSSMINVIPYDYISIGKYTCMYIMYVCMFDGGIFRFR